MVISLTSFNAHAINTGNYQAYLDVGDRPYMRSIAPVIQRPSGRDPRYMRADTMERLVVVHVHIVAGTIAAGRLELEGWFEPGTEGELIVAYEGVNRALRCVVTQFISYDGSANQFTAVMMAMDPLWHSQTRQTVTQQQTVSGATWAVANDGNAAEYKGIYTVQTKTAKATANGYTFKREFIVANRVARPFAGYALMTTIDHAALTTTKSLASGNDVRVRLDGVETPRWVNTQAGRTWDTATCDIWFNLTLSPGKFATLFADITASVPAGGGELEVVKGGTSGWPTSGALLIDDEVITYTGVTLKSLNGREAFTGVGRAARNTTAAIHTTTDVIYWVERRVQLIYGYSGAGAPDARNELKPMLDLTSATLTNTLHQWLDFAHATDPRSMQWARRSVARDDQEPRFIRAATGSPAAALAFTFDPDGPSVGNPLGNQWERDFPSGTDGNIAITRTIDDTMAVQVFSLDADGNELKGTEANNGLLLGPLTSASENHDPGDVYGLRVWGFNQIVAQSPLPLLTSTSFVLPVGVNTSTGQQFTTGSEPLTITAIMIRVIDSGTPRTVSAELRSDTGADVPASAEIAITNSAVTSAGAAVWLTLTFTTPPTLQPNTKYWILPYTAAGADVNWYVQNTQYPGGKARDASTNTARACVFRLAGYAAPTAASLVRCDDNCLADDGDSASVTALTVPLLATGIPYLNLMAEQACYWTNGVLSNNSTGQTVTFDVICVDEDTLVIDVEERTALNTVSGENILSQLRFSDPDEWIRLAPGSNTFAWTEAGIVRQDIIADYWDRYA